jgi:hypothetical protein
MSCVCCHCTGKYIRVKFVCVCDCHTNFFAKQLLSNERNEKGKTDSLFFNDLLPTLVKIVAGIILFTRNEIVKKKILAPTGNRAQDHKIKNKLQDRALTH